MRRKVVKNYTQDQLFEGSSKELDPITGFITDTDQDIIAKELLAGGDSRAEIVERVTGLLDEYTREGNPKQTVNLVGNVILKLLKRGWTIESSYRLVPPRKTPRKRAAK